VYCDFERKGKDLVQKELKFAVKEAEVALFGNATI
jgi:hypothetical protein